jgi:hypothetical protein
MKKWGRLQYSWAKEPRYTSLLKGLGAEWLESYARVPIIFTILVLFTEEIIETPERVKKYTNNRWFKFLLMVALAMTAVPDLEVAIISVLLYMIGLYAFKTKKERKENGFF